MEVSNEGWRRYYERTADRGARETLLTALGAWAGSGHAPGRALDIGCGAGRDTLELLKRGWTVVALDAEASALEALQHRIPDRYRARLTCRRARIEDALLPESDLVNASFCLFLLDAGAFGRSWDAIRRTLVPGGLFAGQLLGPEDNWAGREGLSFHDRRSVEALVTGYRILLRREERTEGATPRGKHKRWHLHHLVLQRLADPED